MKEALLFDQGMLSEDDLFNPFALTDVLTEFSGEQQQPVIHFWQLPKTLILGMKDSRVPHLNAALKTVHQQNYRLVLRNSGGLGVMNDTGILNISLILPKETVASSIDDGYQAMVDWFQHTPFGSLGLTVGEVADSYCPGKFDLSIKGKKIAGIAQRRIKDGVAIMMYLSVDGDQQLRGEIVRAFYQSGLQDQFGIDYPAVEPSSMTTLAETAPFDVSLESVKKELLQAMPYQDQSAFLPNFFQMEEYQRRIENMRQRNTTIQEVLHDL